MTWTAHWRQLHRFFAVLIVLVLPLQGQAAASMACHTMPAGLSGMTAPMASRSAGSHEHVGPHKHTHHVSAVHHQDSHHPVLSSASIVDPASDIASTIDAQSPFSESVSKTAAADTCALCAAGCTMAAPLPVSDKTISPQSLEQHQPLWQITSVYAGVVLDGLLRPPR